MSGLDESLLTWPIRHDLKPCIVSSIFGVHDDNINASTHLHNLEAWFECYTQQCDIALHDRGRYTSARSHRDIVFIVDYIKKGLPKDSILVEIEKAARAADKESCSESLNASIDLAVRLVTMVSIGCIPNYFQGRKPLLWKSGSLQSFLGERFPLHGKLEREHVKLERFFMAKNFWTRAGVKIRWTHNLADHLRMVGDDSEVEIFHHAAFLKSVQRGDILKIFPPGFIEETIRSMTLLFPRTDRQTVKWYKKLHRKEHLDPEVTECGCLRAEDRQIDCFGHWRDRIVILKQVFDESRPNSWRQYWYDQRNGFERFPILLAAAALVLTAIFGLVQCLENALQVYKAYHPTLG